MASKLSTAHLNGVALDLLRTRGVSQPREWIEKKLERNGPGMSGIELHRQIETGVPGKAIPNLLMVLDFTREDFSDLLGRARKTLNELEQRAHLSRSDSDLLYRIARALVYAVSVFGESDYAVQWLKEPNEALAGAIPLKLLATVEGDEIVRAELGGIEHGLPV
ncbi:MAG: antitoxin Xre/MbcA/ParS toxin-binding domain-containing protein [Gammaproteobacteria bacterium]